MSPSTPDSQPPAAAQEQKPIQPMQVDQPAAHRGMDPQRPHADTEANLRGGEDRGGCCPGRFCFIIPCPLPCDCCIIPCP